MAGQSHSSFHQSPRAPALGKVMGQVTCKPSHLHSYERLPPPHGFVKVASYQVYKATEALKTQGSTTDAQIQAMSRSIGQCRGRELTEEPGQQIPLLQGDGLR